MAGVSHQCRNVWGVLLNSGPVVVLALSIGKPYQRWGPDDLHEVGGSNVELVDHIYLID